MAVGGIARRLREQLSRTQSPKARTGPVAEPVAEPLAEPAAQPVGATTFVSADPVADFWSRAQPIERRHRAQTEVTVAALNKKYLDPLFGAVPVWDLIQRLSNCIDPTDCRLFCASQLVHVLQVLEGMAQEGVSDRDLLLTALIHDLGKLMLLTEEDPANISGLNSVIGRPQPGVGLDNCVMQWNHDELAYMRFKDLVPDHVAWLLRYHSMDRDACRPFMDERDREYDERYLAVFSRYDHDTKTAYLRPSVQLDAYKYLIDEAFPEPIAF